MCLFSSSLSSSYIWVNTIASGPNRIVQGLLTEMSDGGSDTVVVDEEGKEEVETVPVADETAEWEEKGISEGNGADDGTAAEDLEITVEEEGTAEQDGSAPFPLVQLQDWWTAAGCKKEGKYYPTVANYENNWWLTITEDQVKADMANYKAKADAGEVTAEGVPYKELAYGPEPQSNDAAGATGEETAEESSDAPENAGGSGQSDESPAVEEEATGEETTEASSEAPENAGDSGQSDESPAVEEEAGGKSGGGDGDDDAPASAASGEEEKAEVGTAQEGAPASDEKEGEAAAKQATDKYGTMARKLVRDDERIGQLFYDQVMEKTAEKDQKEALGNIRRQLSTKDEGNSFWADQAKTIAPAALAEAWHEYVMSRPVDARETRYRRLKATLAHPHFWATEASIIVPESQVDEEVKKINVMATDEEKEKYYVHLMKLEKEGTYWAIKAKEVAPESIAQSWYDYIMARPRKSREKKFEKLKINIDNGTLWIGEASLIAPKSCTQEWVERLRETPEEAQETVYLRLHERVEKRTYWADEAFNLTLQGNPRTGNSNELAKAKFDEIMALPEHERETAYRAMKGSKKQELPNDRSMSTGVNSIKIEPPAGQGGCCTIA